MLGDISAETIALFVVAPSTLLLPPLIVQETDQDPSVPPLPEEVETLTVGHLAVTSLPVESLTTKENECDPAEEYIGFTLSVLPDIDP